MDWDELDQFAANPLNWKRHPQRQQKAVLASIKADGWGRALTFNINTGRFIDGHGRRKLAIQQKLTNIPINIGWWTEEQERRLLRNADPIGGMYETDKDALASLNQLLKSQQKDLRNLESQTQATLAQLQNDMEAFAEEAPKTLIPQSKKRARISKKQKEEDHELTTSSSSEEPELYKQVLQDDILFPSSNPWGLPDLLPDRMATPEEAPRSVFDRSRGFNHTPTTLYCHSIRPYPEERQGGVLGFFTEDWRFEHVYEYPADFLELLLEEDWSALIAPDFSTYHEWPHAMRLWNLYRSRWCARYWQEAGFSIIPTVGLTLPAEEEMFFSTLPPSPVVACRVFKSEGKNHWKNYGRFISLAVERLQTQVVVLYGGSEFVKYLHGFLPSGPEYIYLHTFMALRRQALKKK